MQIKINVAGKKATTPPETYLVCGNSDQTILFSFDSEWKGQELKTARFNYEVDGETKRQEVVFTGNECEVPILSGIKRVEIGVYAGDLLSTTPCPVKCYESILCEGGAHMEPTPDVYNQIMEEVNKGFSESAIKKVVDGEEKIKYTGSAIEAETLEEAIEKAFENGGMTEIPDKSITGEKLAEGAVNTYELADNSVTEDKILGNAVTASKIRAGEIKDYHLNSELISYLKEIPPIPTAGIKDGAVTPEKLDRQYATQKSLEETSDYFQRLYDELYDTGDGTPMFIFSPSVTPEDEGKFLRVSSTGEWIAEAVPSFEESEF